MNDLLSLRKLIFRAIPGIGGWHVARFGKISRVYESIGPEVQSPAKVVVDLDVLGPDLKRDKRFKKPLMRVMLSSANPYDDTAPEKGRICLYHHPYWRADLAVVTGYLYTGRSVKVAEKMVHFQGFSEFRIGSADDFAVMYGPLQVLLGKLIDSVDKLAQADNWGSPLPNYAVEKPKLAQLKLDLTTLKSNIIKLGKNAS